MPDSFNKLDQARSRLQAQANLIAAAEAKAYAPPKRKSSPRERLQNAAIVGVMIALAAASGLTIYSSLAARRRAMDVSYAAASMPRRQAVPARDAEIARGLSQLFSPAAKHRREATSPSQTTVRP